MYYLGDYATGEDLAAQNELPHAFLRKVFLNDVERRRQADLRDSDDASDSGGDDEDLVDLTKEACSWHEHKTEEDAEACKKRHEAADK